MQKEKELIVLKARLSNLISRGKSIECPGVRRKLERKVRNLEAIVK
jgi:hypothetical protein